MKYRSPGFKSDILRGNFLPRRQPPPASSHILEVVWRRNYTQTRFTRSYMISQRLVIVNDLSKKTLWKLQRICERNRATNPSVFTIFSVQNMGKHPKRCALFDAQFAIRNSQSRVKPYQTQRSIPPILRPIYNSIQKCTVGTRRAVSALPQNLPYT